MKLKELSEGDLGKVILVNGEKTLVGKDFLGEMSLLKRIGTSIALFPIPDKTLLVESSKSQNKEPNYSYALMNIVFIRPDDPTYITLDYQLTEAGI